jgi:starvation-inducible outer membrane lipoprotein
MATRTSRLLLLLAALSLTACVVYEPMPVAQPTLQQRYERSWAAATQAMMDQGVTVVAQDRVGGVIRGERGNTTITAIVEARSDDRIQVTFNAKGADDGGLVQRVSDSYDRRMGR